MQTLVPRAWGWALFFTTIFGKKEPIKIHARKSLGADACVAMHGCLGVSCRVMMATPYLAAAPSGSCWEMGANFGTGFRSRAVSCADASRALA